MRKRISTGSRSRGEFASSDMLAIGKLNERIHHLTKEVINESMFKFEQRNDKNYLLLLFIWLVMLAKACFRHETQMSLLSEDL